MSTFQSPIPNPQSLRVGILGAGQLGKMLCEAANTLGLKTHVFAPDEDPIAASVATKFTQANYTDIEALQAFADSVDVITLEFENVPVAPLKQLRTRISPSTNVLEVTQHRVKEKELARSLGIGTAPFRAVKNSAEAQAAISEIGVPGILKTCTMGYDGKGQWKVGDSDQWSVVSKEAFPDHRPPTTDLIYEGFVNFVQEISVIVARSTTGEIQCFEPAENVHKNHILHTTTVPANISEDVKKKAIAIAEKLATALDVIGLLAVEMFVTKTGDVLVNEMAPRPHNSGHWTLDGCNVSQFEQALRAVVGMPLMKPERIAPKVVMTNLIGDEINDEAAWMAKGGVVKNYGKKEVRAGRKMGHVNQLK